MLETLIVYGLILLFFVLLAGFVGVVLTQHPYTDPATQQQQNATMARAKRAEGAKNGISYGIIAGLLFLYCVLTVLQQRQQSSH